MGQCIRLTHGILNYFVVLIGDFLISFLEFEKYEYIEEVHNSKYKDDYPNFHTKGFYTFSRNTLPLLNKVRPTHTMSPILIAIYAR